MADRRCSVCRETKSPDEFYRDASRPSGRMVRCKVCEKERQRLRYAPSLMDKSPCAECGGALPKFKRVVCSRRCEIDRLVKSDAYKLAKQQYEEAQGRFWITRSVRAQVYERDGWVCQLCGDPVDPDLDPNDSWAASLDHVVPQAWTLVPDHSPENLQLAHRWCNSVRGDERHYSSEVLRVSEAAS